MALADCETSLSFLSDYAMRSAVYKIAMIIGI